MNVKELKKTKLSDCFKITTRVYVVAIIFLLITIVFFGWAFVLEDTNKSDAKDFLESRIGMQTKDRCNYGPNIVCII